MQEERQGVGRREPTGLGTAEHVQLQCSRLQLRKEKFGGVEWWGLTAPTFSP